MYSTLFTPADLAADARADMQTIAVHIRLLTPAEARGAGVELAEMARRVNVWERIALREGGQS